MSAAERGDLAERLLPIAAGLACIVHGDGVQRDIAHVLAQLDSAERDALVVVLAGLVDPDATLKDVLGYLTWDEHERVIQPTRLTRTLREIAVQPKLPSPLLAHFRDEQITEARVRYHQLGHHQDDIARDLGVHERTVGRWVRQPATA